MSVTKSWDVTALSCEVKCLGALNLISSIVSLSEPFAAEETVDTAIVE